MSNKQIEVVSKKSGYSRNVNEMNEMLVKGREILVVSYVAASPQLHPRCTDPTTSAKNLHHVMIELVYQATQRL